MFEGKGHMAPNPSLQAGLTAREPDSAARNEIAPSVGRKVWYRPSADDVDGRAESQIETAGDQPVDATIVAVWGPRMVSLAIFDAGGKHHTRRSVTLVQPGDEIPANGRYVMWMPYQVGQAKQEADKAGGQAAS